MSARPRSKIYVASDGRWSSKVGVSNSPVRRMMEMRRPSRFLMDDRYGDHTRYPKLAWELELGHRALAVERAIKERFSDRCIDGYTEWFRVTQKEMIEAVLEECASLTIEQALAHEDMKGWNRSAAYRDLGTREIFKSRN